MAKVVEIVDKLDMFDSKALRESLQVANEIRKKKGNMEAARTVGTGLKHALPSKKEIVDAINFRVDTMPIVEPVYK